MNSTSPAGTRQGGLLRSLFGSRTAASGHLAHSSPAIEARRDILDSMAALFLANDLELTPANLLAAHAAFSGADFRLGRKIAQRQFSGEPITQAWLDEMLAGSGVQGSGRDGLDSMVAHLEHSVGKFRKTTHQARVAAADYRSQLSEQVDRIEDTSTTEEFLADLAGLARAMLERTHEIEAKMKASEQEASDLRRNLDKAQHNAETDHLTSLPNRRAFEKLFEREYRIAKEAIEPLSVAFCDLDRFKRINDTYGHDTGDRVLQIVARVFARISDDRCHVARHGGEEFVMLFRGRDVHAARQRLDEARVALAERRFRSRATDDFIGNVTFSCGIADVFAYSDPRAALRAADEALYAAKQAGRNRIELAGEHCGVAA